MKKLLAFLLLATLLLSGCTPSAPEIEGTAIALSDSGITVDGQPITEDPTQAVYSARDIVFYLADQGFTYGEGEKADEHTQEQADAHTVVHITKPGKYVLSGKLSLGQIAVDLGENAETDPNAVVTLVLNGVDITCEVAPAVIFYNVYECCNSDEETATKDVDTSNAGANVIIADSTVNNITGSYVAKIYKSYELNEDGTEVVDSKKLHKYDAAFYSKKTLNVTGGSAGSGVLNIKAENEGLDSELHLTINGGIINIVSGNDGINTNEDYVSVTTINGGVLNILCDGSTGEGDGIDSNGWLVINGGSVTAQACATSGDAGIDSDMGIYINGGTVIASGNMLDRIAGGEQTYAVFNFASAQPGSAAYTLKNADGKAVSTVSPENAFTYLLIAGDALTPGEYTFWKDDVQLSASTTGAMGNMHGGRPGMPGGTPPDGERPEGWENMTPPNGEMPERPDGGEDMTPPDGEGATPPDGIPQPPDGGTPPNAEDGTPPDNMGGTPGGNMIPGGETSTTFTFTAGANQFMNVAPAQ